MESDRESKMKKKQESASFFSDDKSTINVFDVAQISFSGIFRID
jgi:hypothetical protein